MFIVDTNVVSELMRPQPAQQVRAWMRKWLWDDLYVTAITEAEIRRGLATMSGGARRRFLVEGADRLFGRAFLNRILPFDSDTAKVYAGVFAERRAQGRPISMADCMIAAIAKAHGMAVATRNVAGLRGHRHRRHRPVGWGQRSDRMTTIREGDLLWTPSVERKAAGQHHALHCVAAGVAGAELRVVRGVVALVG